MIATAAVAPSLVADPVAGESLFRRCVACHRIMAPEQEIVAGGTIGPNLYGIAGRLVGGLEGYRYGDGDGLAALAARGLR